MPRFRPTLALLLLAVVPGPAFAHGEGVLLFPFGTLIAVLAVVALGLLWKIRWFAVVGASVLAFAASLPLWFIPGNYFPAAMQHADWGYFVTGFVPSFTVGTVVIWLFRHIRRPTR